MLAVCLLAGCANPASDAGNSLIGTWRAEEVNYYREYYIFTADTVTISYYRNDELRRSEGPYRYEYDNANLYLYENETVVYQDTEVEHERLVTKKEYTLDGDLFILFELGFLVSEQEIRYTNIPTFYTRWPGPPAGDEEAPPVPGPVPRITFVSLITGGTEFGVQVHAWDTDLDVYKIVVEKTINNSYSSEEVLINTLEHYQQDDPQYSFFDITIYDEEHEAGAEVPVSFSITLFDLAGNTSNAEAFSVLLKYGDRVLQVEQIE
jgi:hypothetical protein